ncbi:M1 family metallopeptidase [Paraliomyxa miuraensis]|uniref:M1 family metallopeptidase n=1 Tax=Paraliomyxa miuraensis TaxID=376150 RepID=UPI00224D4DFC|nr:M1 family metallopeptidase [Paraliomyxa miuraensis]MCX4246454.1 M1 family metallopeptidase [Paraliomyxa miuraensis]
MNGGDLSHVEPGSDPHSYARPDEVVVRHMGLQWTVSFEDRRLVGHATLWVERRDPSAPLWLDTRDLDIEAVQTAPRPANLEESSPALARIEGAAWTEAAWARGERDPILGQPLRIELPPQAELVRIAYRTSPQASGLQWLEPRQTADGTDPFLYSQSQAIHARSWIPCQDSPGVRVTYDATVLLPVTAQAEDRVALMSARRVESPQLGPGEHRFEMPQPIPAYLVALAVGRVEQQSLGERSGVWAEPSVLPRAAREFADVERMMEVAESLFGPYRWERYDVLVLPPAFPFGGMENPRLTFATPTILAGDRSLVSLVAHELAHSWSGNLVTNATWEDTWLNEGFTVYIERRIVEALYGRGRSEMEALLGRQDLQDEIEGLDEPGDSRLHVALRGRDPDEALSDVAYEKGALFLRELEESYGREAFDPFVRKWFDSHAFTSVSSQELEAFLDRELVKVAVPLPSRQVARPQVWIHEPGVPEGAPQPRSDAFERVDAVIDALASGKTSVRSLPTRDWTPHQWLHFLRGLPAELPARTLTELDATFALTASTNYEILAQWLELSILRGHAAVDERLEQFLTTVGRRKFLVPLYEALLAAGRRGDALRIYERSRAGYHPITQHSLDTLLRG